MNNKNQSAGIAGQISQSQSSPPLVRLTLRVGITGHRPNNLQFADVDTLRSRIQTVLEFLKATVDALRLRADSLYSTDPPLIRVISPLAEGSDRLLAEVANSLGEQFKLQCVLPFSQEEYEKDFHEPESQRQFRKLLKTASSVLELEGSRETPDCRDRSYETLGKVVLNHSDVMIAVWDGEPGQRGGTSQMVNKAEALNIPLIWINSKAPHDINVKLNQVDGWMAWGKGVDSLSAKLETLLLPPLQTETLQEAEKQKQKPDLLTAYFKETGRRWMFASFWKLFRKLVAVKVPPAVDAATPRAILPSDISDQIESALGDHYRWADQLADYYADVYRSAFVFNYLMSAFAVLFAFLGILIIHNETAALLLTVAEVMIIVAIIVVTFLGIRYYWHERWIDYRLLAEHLRHTQLLMALGRASVSVLRFPIYISYGDPRNSWMYWHIQAIVRHSGIMRVKFDRNYLETVRSFLRERIRDQINYHERNAIISESLNQRLRNVGLGLFLLAFAAALLHLILHVVHDERWNIPLTTLTIVGPSFGAALAAIRSQGEFERLTKSSRAMSSQLQSVSNNLQILNNNDLSSVMLGDLAVESAQLMVKDVLNWRLVVEEKPLDLPA